MNIKASSQVNFRADVITQHVRQAVTVSVDQSTAIVLEEAEAIVPVAGGELRESGRTIPATGDDTITGRIEFTAGHAAFVEFGTGIRGMGTYPYPLPQAGVPFTGGWVYDYKHQNWIGMPAQPYLRPALDTARPAIRAVFRDNIEAAVKSV